MGIRIKTKTQVNKCVDCKKTNVGYIFGLIVLGTTQLAMLVFIGGYVPILGSNVIFTYQIHSLIIERSEYQSVLSIISSFNAEISLTHLLPAFDACLAPISGLGKGLIRLFFAMFLLILAVIAVKYCSRFCDRISYKQIAQRSWLVVQASVMPVFVSLSSIFSCRETSYLGVIKNRMVEFPDVICSEPTYISIAIIIGLLFVLPTFIGIIYVQTQLYKNQADFFNSESLTKVLSDDYESLLVDRRNPRSNYTRDPCGNV
jgi:hypothetical protein